MLEWAHNCINNSFIPLPTIFHGSANAKYYHRQQARFSEYRGKRQKLFRVLGNVLKPIELLGNLAAGGASVAFPPSSLVFGAVLYLINAGQGVSACYDAITNLFNEVQDFTSRLSVHSKQDISQELREIVTKILVSLINLCDISAKLVKDGRIKKYFKGLLLGEDDKVKAEMADLQRLTESEERMTGALTLSVVTTTDKKVDELRELMLRSNDPKPEQRDDNERKQLENLREMLGISNNTPQEMYDIISRKRVPGE